MKTTIKINHVNVKVLTAPATLAQAADMRGLYDPHTQTIYVSEELDGELLKRVLWHEIMHAFFEIYGWAEKIDQEDDVIRTSSALTAFMQENPDFVWDFLA